jgi:hypothetical protein
VLTVSCVPYLGRCAYIFTQQCLQAWSCTLQPLQQVTDPGRKMGPGKGGGHFWHPFPEQNITQIPSFPASKQFPSKIIIILIIIIHILILLLLLLLLAESALERQIILKSVCCVFIVRFRDTLRIMGQSPYTASPTDTTSMPVVDLPRSAGGG